MTEVYGYERINIFGGGKRDGDGLYSEENYQQTQKARRDNIRRLITQNFDLNDKFVSLTFAENMTDISKANYEFKKFVVRMKRKYPNFEYVAVIEFQKRGAIHYHMVCNLPYVPNEEFAKIWKQGFIKINKISHVDNIGAYVTKYMNKNLDDDRLRGKQAYNRSRGLIEPQEFREWKPDEVLEMDKIVKELKGKSASYSAKYETENAGKIVYLQFNTERQENQSQDIVSPLPNSSVMTSSL